MPEPTLSLAKLDLQAVRDVVTAEVARVLAFDPQEIDPAKSFDAYGLDSTDAIVIVGRLEEHFEIELPPELMLRSRSVDEVMRDLENLSLENTKPP